MYVFPFGFKMCLQLVRYSDYCRTVWVLLESIPSLLGLLVSAVVIAKLIDLSSSSTHNPPGTVRERAVSYHKSVAYA